MKKVIITLSMLLLFGITSYHLDRWSDVKFELKLLELDEILERKDQEWDRKRQYASIYHEGDAVNFIEDIPVDLLPYKIINELNRKNDAHSNPLIIMELSDKTIIKQLEIYWLSNELIAGWEVLAKGKVFRVLVEEGHFIGLRKNLR